MDRKGWAVSFDDDIFDAGDMNPGYYVGPSPALVKALAADLKVTRGPSVIYPAPTERTQAMEESRSYTMDEVRANNAKARGRGALKENRAALMEKRRLAELLLDQIEEEIYDINERLEKAKPAEPGPGHDRFSVLVKFGGPRSKEYEFLLLRSGGKWFTTGTSVQAKVFESWDALVDWLEGSDVKWHSDLQRLTLSSEAWSLQTGALIVNGNGEAPF